MSTNKKETKKILKEEYPNKQEFEVNGFVDSMFRLANLLEYYNLKHCNKGLEPKEEEKQEVYKEKAREACKAFGIDCILQGDPRGCAFKFILPSERSNSMFERSWGLITDEFNQNV